MWGASCAQVLASAWHQSGVGCPATGATSRASKTRRERPLRFLVSHPRLENAQTEALLFTGARQVGEEHHQRRVLRGASKPAHVGAVWPACILVVPDLPEVGPLEVCFLEVSASEVGSLEVASSEVCRPELSMSEIRSSHVCVHELTLLEVDSLQLSPPEVRERARGLTELESLAPVPSPQELCQHHFVSALFSRLRARVKAPGSASMRSRLTRGYRQLPAL